MTFDELLNAYNYELPQELVAKEPASPRDSARLMVYDRMKDTSLLDTFQNLGKYLPHNAVLVFNQTKVLPAKFNLKKSTGGIVDALYLGTNGEMVEVLASGSLKPGDTLDWEDNYRFEVRERNSQRALLKANFDVQKIRSLLEKFGTTPLPPYMKDSPLDEARRRNEYQTTFAKNDGSVAAPTAGLHFTDALMKSLSNAGHTILFVTLHVNLGTFAPLTEEQWNMKKLHTEFYEIDEKTARALEEAKKSKRPIVAVGTTTVRALESASENGNIARRSGSTDLFISERDDILFVDHLITNFHVPRSSLMMLVSAFTGRERLLALYRQAMDRKMRFFSFGDGMLIL